MFIQTGISMMQIYLYMYFAPRIPAVELEKSGNLGTWFPPFLGQNSEKEEEKDTTVSKTCSQN